jgi:hypothetical protein
MCWGTVGRLAREHRDLEGAHPAWRQQLARRQGRVLCVEEHLVPHCEAHVPPVRFELSLAPVLQLLQQRQHLAGARHLRQQAGSRVAVTRVWWCGEQQRAARVLAAVGSASAKKGA